MKTIFASILGLWVAVCSAQTDLQRAENLVTCLGGKYSSLCKRAWLTDEQKIMTDKAERRENLKTCLTGKYPSLCKKNLLTESEANRTMAAEKRENLEICLTGRFRSLCKKELLTIEERHRVSVAEKSENLKTCLDGRYPILCDRQLLNAEQLKAAMAAERRLVASAPPTGTRQSRPRGVYGPSDCNTSQWVDSVSSDGGILRLGDGSIWEISVIDKITSMLWLPTSDVIVCDGKLINTDDNESVEARRLR